MKKYKLGFTLIELLAVVLIVAILTSVALPQYRRSVRRAEAIEAMTNLRAIYDAAKRYKAAASEKPTALNQLDISFFDATSDDSDKFSIGKFDYTLSSSGVKACRRNSGGYCFHLYYYYALCPETSRKDCMTCSYTSSAGKWVCESLGGDTVASSEHLIEG